MVGPARHINAEHARGACKGAVIRSAQSTLPRCTVSTMMAQQPLQNVLIAGGTSDMGRVFLEELLQHPFTFKIGVLTRASSAAVGLPARLCGGVRALRHYTSTRRATCCAGLVCRILQSKPYLTALHPRESVSSRQTTALLKRLPRPSRVGGLTTHRRRAQSPLARSRLTRKLRLARSNPGWDALVSLLGKESLMVQEKLLLACKAAGTRRFLPSEWGLDLGRVG